MKNFIELILKKYSFYTECVGGGFWSNFTKSAGWTLEKLIIDLKKQYPDILKRPLQDYLNAIVKQNQFVDLIQNGCTQIISLNKNKHWEISYTYTSESLFEIKIRNELWSKRVKFSGEYFLPCSFNRVDEQNKNIYIKLKGFPLSKSASNINEAICNYLNDVINKICFSFPISEQLYCDIQNDPKLLLSQINKIHKKIYREFILYMPEIKDILGPNGFTTVLYTLSEDLDFKEYIDAIFNLWSVKPYDVVLHMIHPSKHVLSDFYSKTQEKLLGDITKLEHKMLRLVLEFFTSDNLRKKSKNFFVNIFDNDFLLGMYIWKFADEPFSLPCIGRWKRFDNIGFTFFNEQNELIRMPWGSGKYKGGKPSIFFFSVDFKKWRKTGRTITDLQFPFRSPRLSKNRIQIKFTSNMQILNHWKILLKTAGIDKKLISCLKPEASLTQSNEMFHLMVIIMNLYQKNWDLFFKTMWNTKKLNPSIDNVSADVNIENEQIYYTNPITKEKIKVHVAMCKIYKKPRGYEVIHKHYLPISGSYFGRYINRLNYEFSKIEM